MLGKGSSRAGGKTIRGDNMIEGKKQKENINGITTIANRFITPAGKCLNTKRAHRQGEPMPVRLGRGWNMELETGSVRWLCQTSALSSRSVSGHATSPSTAACPHHILPPQSPFLSCHLHHLQQRAGDAWAFHPTGIPFIPALEK